MTKTIIQAKSPESISVINDKTLIECTPEYCLVDLGKYVFKLNPAEYRTVEIAIELAQQMHDEKYGFKTGE